jgi:hypothetical protein
MRNTGFRTFLILTLFVFTGTALAGNYATATQSSVKNVPRSDTLSNDVKTVLCPDIAIMPEFRSGGLDYVHSVEFADAVYAVASGTSKYSPEAVPPEWMATASRWWRHVVVKETATISIPRATNTLRSIGEAGSTTAGLHEIRLLSPTGEGIDLEQAGLTGESCSPSLLFRASLEYRNRTGHSDAKLVYPYKVRTAAQGLGDSIRVKLEMAKKFANRANKITEMIARAEKMGAANCQQEELAMAKYELSHTRRLLADIHTDTQETEASLTKVELAAGSILRMHRLASSRGGESMCY